MPGPWSGTTPDATSRPGRVAAGRFLPPRFGFTTSGFADLLPEAESVVAATVGSAYTAGLRFFDSSPADGGGKAEEGLGRALAERTRAGFLLSTRIAGDLPADQTQDRVAASLRRLGVTSVDLALLQDPGGATGAAAFSVLSALRDRGRIGAIGVAGGDWRRLDRFVGEREVDAVLLSDGYSLLDHSAGPLLDRCLTLGIPVVVSSGTQWPGGSGPVAGRAQEFTTVCERYGVTLPQVMLAFPARHPAVASVLVAAAAPAGVRAAAALVRHQVPEAFWRDPELARLLAD